MREMLVKLTTDGSRPVSSDCSSDFRLDHDSAEFISSDETNWKYFERYRISYFMQLWVVHKWRHGRRGEGVKDFVKTVLRPQ